MKTKICIVILAVALAATVGVGIYREIGAEPASEAYASSIYDKITPELIELYESEIAGENVVSGKSDVQLTRLANKLGVGRSKLNALLIVQDLAARANDPIGLSSLAKMSDIALIKFAKQCADAYLATQSSERREELKKLFLAEIKDCLF